jgi:hypothetical protein
MVTPPQEAMKDEDNVPVQVLPAIRSGSTPE